MRPKKRVLLYCADADLGGMVGKVLETRLTRPGVKVTPAACVAEVERRSQEKGARFDCIVIYRTAKGRDSADDGRSTSLLASIGFEPKIVKVDNGMEHDPFWRECRCVPGARIEEIMRAVFETCQGRRGPRKREAVPA